VIKQTACAAIASSRPIASSSPSPPLTLTFTRSRSTFSTSARRACMAARCGPSRGAWAMMTVSRLTIRRPFVSSMAATSSSSRRLEMSL
jgi:hypothetical protein